MFRLLAYITFSSALALAAPAVDDEHLVPRVPDPGAVITQCASPGMLALAYDDGPSQYTSELVDILDAANAKATFFFTGTLYGCIYDQASAVQKAYNSGHQIASHTWYSSPTILLRETIADIASKDSCGGVRLNE